MEMERFVAHFFDLINRRDMDAFGGILQEKAEFYFPKTQPLQGRAVELHDLPTGIEREDGVGIAQSFQL